MYGAMYKMVVNTLLILLLLLSSVPYTFNSKPNGGLEINEEAIFISQYIIVGGNVTVRSGGRLILINSTLQFNCQDKCYLIVDPGGALILNNSKITGPEDKYTIFINDGAELIMVNSVIENAGWKDHENDGKYIWIGPAYTNDWSTYGHGLEINTTVKVFRGNVFRNIASIRFYSSNNIIEDNIVVNMRHEGMAFIGSNNNIIRNNIFINGTLNRETYGLRFYPGTRDQLIYNNTFENLCIGMLISLIPPWTPCVNFTIHDNRMHRVVQGLMGRLYDSQIYNESYEYLWSLGIMLAASKNVVVEKCRIGNLTFIDESIASEEYFQECREYIHPQYPRAYYNFLILLRGGILVSWSGNNIIIKYNDIYHIPPYGYGIGFDVKYIAYNVKIINNTFRHICDFQPPWNVSGPGLGSVRLDKIYFQPPGGAIEIESTENLLIENNTFISCLNGILTSFPDAIGNYGNLTIRNNLIVGTYYTSWIEKDKTKYWYGIGIGVGTRAYRPNENGERWRVYNSKSTIVIAGNEVVNYTYALIVDLYNETLKKAIVENNTFNGYYEIITSQTVDLSRNILKPNLPDLKIANLTVETIDNTMMLKVKVAIETAIPFFKIIYIEIKVDDEVVKKWIKLNASREYIIKHKVNVSKGRHSVEVFIDTTNVIKEVDEDNNYIRKIVEVPKENYMDLIMKIAPLLLIALTVIILYLVRKCKTYYSADE
ncbi:MAG: hypothetical protein DRJ32_02390 [Thermoprotei archaeon]|nr:MAG: hypothetical protein DRJ32_02390 [Thermoprotei archaeon]HDD63721.1 hypothetical protein [Thermoprotei archaeon]